jgi:hypothetical protein
MGPFPGARLLVPDRLSRRPGGEGGLIEDVIERVQVAVEDSALFTVAKLEDRRVMSTRPSEAPGCYEHLFVYVVRGSVQRSSLIRRVNRVEQVAELELGRSRAKARLIR